MNIIRQLRESRGMQQKEFALRIGVSQPTVSEWEHGKKDPSGDRLVKIAQLFGISPLEVLGIPLDPSTNEKPKKYFPTDEELQFALFDGTECITKEDFEDVKRYAKFVAARRQSIIHDDNN